MTFRVNHNVRAVNAHRNLQYNQSDLSKSLERLSSGLKINRASDGPAAFAISEHLRSQIVGVNQAIDNSQTAVSLLQTTEANMGEITSLLTGVRQLIIHSLNSGANDSVTLAADQSEIENSLSTIHQIALNARFGEKKLLDGSNGVTGTTTGENLEFSTATMATKDSSENGFEVRITQVATKSAVSGNIALTQEMVDAGEKLVIIEKGKMAGYTTNRDDTVNTAVQKLRSEIQRNNLNVDIDLDESGIIEVKHREYGSGHSFQVTSSSAGVLSAEGGDIMSALEGKNVKGTINGESAKGEGRLLTGINGAKCTDGLSVYYYADGKELLNEPGCVAYDLESEGNSDQQEGVVIPEEGIPVGRAYISQNSMTFQVGSNLSNTVGFSLSDMKPVSLATDVINKSEFRSLADINVETYDNAQDSLRIVDRAIGQISGERGRLGAIQKNALETNLSNLKVANENLISSESIIRDTDMAKEMAVYTRDQIKTQSSAAMLAQANQISEEVLRLLH
jgi:flagellin